MKKSQAQKIVIIGGGNIGYSLCLKLLMNSEYKIATNIIEYDKKRSEYSCYKFKICKCN